MHEMSLISNVLDMVLARCTDTDVARISKVKIVVGEARDVVDELAVGLFEHLARGTIAETAVLEIVRVPLTVRCNRCGFVYPISVHRESTWTCPSCQATKDYHLCTGMEFMVHSIEVEDHRQAAVERIPA